MGMINKSESNIEWLEEQLDTYKKDLDLANA